MKKLSFLKVFSHFSLPTYGFLGSWVFRTASIQSITSDSCLGSRFWKGRQGNTKSHLGCSSWISMTLNVKSSILPTTTKVGNQNIWHLTIWQFCAFLKWYCRRSFVNSEIDLDCTRYEDVLKDGVVLCHLINAIAPGSVKKIQERGTNFQLMENVQRYVLLANYQVRGVSSY